MLHWSLENLAESIKSGNSLLAFEGKKLIGHVCLFEWNDYVEVCALIVGVDSRGQGIGTQLIKEAVRLAKQKFGRKKLIMLPNAESYPIGRKAGFSEKGKNYYEPEIWGSCHLCEEFKCFPDCHCRPMALNDDGEIKIISLLPDDRDLVRSTAELYCQVWRESPWNEDFWKVDEVISEIDSQMKNESAVSLVAVSGNDIVGFTWGYQIRRDAMRIICGNDELDFIFAKDEHCFYVDELATKSEFRHRGTGKKLSLSLLGEARLLGQQRFSLRTAMRAEAARRLYAKIGFKDLGVMDTKYADRTYWLRG